MKKFYFLLLVLIFVSSNNFLNAQCPQATSNFANHNAPTNATFTNTTTCIFGGEYSNIANCLAGAVYEYSTCGDTDFDTQLTVRDGYGGAVLAYNDNACGLQSTVSWTQPSNGTAVISVHRNNCTTQNSCMTLQARRVCLPGGNPATFGTNTWNVYGYNHSGYNFNNQMNLLGLTYKGFYSNTSLDITSENQWASGSSPSAAAGWNGCPVSNDNHTVVYKRQGFPCGVYQIDLDGHDDGVRCYVNGAQVYQIDGCCADRGVIYTGYLGVNSTVEFRVSEGGGGSNLSVDFDLISTLTSSAAYTSASGCNLFDVSVTKPTGAECPWFISSLVEAAPNSQLNGVATYTGGGCRLTPNSGGQYGSLGISNPLGYNASDLSLSYDFFIGNGGGADGMSISYGNIPVSANPGELGTGSGLIIRMVTYTGAGQRVQLVYNNVVLATYNGFPWRNARRACSLTIANGRLSYVIDGTTVFNNVDLGAGYLAANKTGWNWAISARTGGVTDEHYIYNLRISLSEYEYSVGAGWQSSPLFTNLAGGSTYTVQSRPKCSPSCISTVRTIDLPSMLPALSATAVAPTCAGASDGSIDLSVSGAINGARVVKIVQLDNEPFNTNEIQAFELGSGTNVALASNGGIPAMSSVYSPSYPTAWLNDGNTNNGVGAHTNTGINQWQKISWEEPVSLDRIVIYNRDGCCWERLDNIRIEVYGDWAETNLLFSEVVNANVNIGANPGASAYTFNNVNSFSNAPNTFVWSPGGAVTEDISGLVAGSYDVTVTGYNGCVSTLTGITVSDPPAISLNAVELDASCLTTADGSIDLTVTNASLSAVPTAFGNLALWTKADAGVVKNKDGQVIQWQDLSGNDNHFNTTIGDNVQQVTGSIGGQNALRFDATNLMETGNVLNGNFTLIVVGKLNGPNYERLVGSNVKNWLFGWWGGRRDQFFAEGWVSNPATTSNLTSPYIYSGTGNIGADQYSFWRNGTNLVTNSAGGSQAPTSLSLGGLYFANGSEKSNGDIAEVIAYNRVLTDDERRSIEKYLSDKYGIAGPSGVPSSYAWSNGASTQDISALAVGAYNVTVTDAAGCSASGTFNIDNGDVTDPVITCPSNITVNVDPGTCGAVVDYSTTFGPLSLEPIADAYVNSAAPTTNYGGSALLDVDRSFDNTFLKFDLSAIPSGATITGVTLEMTVNDGYAYGGDGNVYTRFVIDDAWSENLITWANQPGASASSLGTWFQWCNFTSCLNANPKLTVSNSSANLAAQVQTEVDGDGIISFRLNSPGYYTQYFSKEHGVLAQRPKLIISYELPVAVVSDNCVNDGLVISRTAGLASGSVFPLGSSTITHRVTDQAGNFDECTFSITVIDNEAPLITCSGNQTVTAGANCEYVHSGNSWNALASDNCGSITSLDYVLSGASTGSGTSLDAAVFSPGITTVTWTASDGSNTQSCSFFVTVNNAPAPNEGSIGNNQMICSGGDPSELTNLTSASGTASPITYQWEEDDNIAFTSPTIVGSNSTYDPGVLTETTFYRRIATDACGTSSVSSNIITITVTSAMTNVMLVSGTSTTASEVCEEGLWTYYANPSTPDQYIFGIKKNGNVFTANLMLTDLPGTATYSSTGGAGPDRGTWLIGRYWNAELTSGSISTDVDIRFFVDLAEITQAENEANAFLNSTIFASDITPLSFFKTTGSNFDPATAMVGGDFTFTPTYLPYTTGSIGGVSYVEMTGITSFSGGTGGFSVNDDGATLPVELLSFDATAIDNEFIRLDWATATEINNDGFELLRSTDGTSFERIAWIEGNGNSTNTHEYVYDDYEVAKGITFYYQLKQIDYDGEFEYFDIVSARLEGRSDFNIGNIVPNPSKENTTVSVAVQSTSEETMTIHIFNHVGVQVASTTKPISSGVNKLKIEIRDLAAGTYFMNFEGSFGMETRKLVIIK